MQRKTSMISLFVLLATMIAASPAWSQSSAEERACTRDVQRFCKHEVPNNDAVLQCLRAHGGQLRPACHQVLVSHGQL